MNPRSTTLTQRSLSKNNIELPVSPAFLPDIKSAYLDAHGVIHFVDEQSKASKVCLVTLTNVEGRSPRRVGEIMAVREDGLTAGSMSSGCVEAAIIAEAAEALRQQAPREVRFGAGSSFIDIRLPCGGGIDLLFQPQPEPTAIAVALRNLQKRQPIMLQQSRQGEVLTCRPARLKPTGWDGETFNLQLGPRLRLMIIGEGAEAEALMNLALVFGADVQLHSPDSRLVTRAETLGASGVWLKTLGASGDVFADQWTAITFLFHNHDWEEALIPQALNSSAFFVGAMGSLQTNIVREASLRRVGITDQAIADLVSPIGSIWSARDPATLALSVLAQVVERHQKLGRRSEP